MEANDDLWRTLQAVDDWIKFADAKAGAVLAADGVLIAVAAQTESDDRITTVFLLPALTLAVLSGLSALWAVIPRLRMVQPDSPLYFDHIAKKRDPDSYRKWVVPLVREPEELVKTLCDLIWAMSRVAAKKYSYVRHATWLLGSASCLVIVAVVVDRVK